MSYRQKLAALVSPTFDLYGTDKSGNYGHAGRPGQVGGSAPGNGGDGGTSRGADSALAVGMAKAGLPHDVELHPAAAADLIEALKEQRLEITDAKPGKDNTYVMKVRPRLPAGIKTHVDEWGTETYYDPRLAEVRPDRHYPDRMIVIPKNEDGWQHELPADAKEAGTLFRGMRHEEYQSVVKTGEVVSRGAYNFENQGGLTFYSTDPDSARVYASGMTPWQHAATFERPAVVVKVKDPGTGVRQKGTGEDERGVPGPVKSSDILDVFIGRPYEMKAGTLIIQQQWDKKNKKAIWARSGGTAPSPRMVWRRASQEERAALQLSYRDKLALLLGGEKSGNYGHAGRPGQVGGSAPGKGDGADDSEAKGKDAPDSGDKKKIVVGAEKVEQAARTIESEMEKFQSDPANSRKEISAAINRKTGEIIFRNDVPYQDEENPRAGGVDDAVFYNEMTAAGDGNVLHYHTHPDDNAFSDGDWKIFSHSHIGEMRVVTNDHIYTVEKTPEFEQKDWKTRYPAKMQERWNKLSDDLWDSTYADMADAPPSEMVAELTRRINQTMADEFGVKFSARKRTKDLHRDLTYWGIDSIVDGIERVDLGGPGSGNFEHAGRPGEVGGSAPGGGDDDGGKEARSPTAVGAAKPVHIDYQDKPDVDAFIKARDQSKRLGFLSPLSAEDLKGHKLYLSKDGTIGGTLSPDGDMGNLFNNGGAKGAAREILLQMLADGGKTADAFDGYLPKLYANFGLVETGRMTFNRDYAPPGWNYVLHDSPDVVFLAKTEDVGSPDDIRERVNDETKAKWIAPTRSGKYYDDYDAAKRDALSLAQNQAERDLLLHCARTDGVEWTVKRAHMILDEARALGEV